MRDIKRIEPFLQELQKGWEKYPDMRFMQLIINMFGESDLLFYMEDDELLKRIQQVVEKGF